MFVKNMKFQKNCEFLNEEFQFGTKKSNRIDIVLFWAL